MKRITIRPFTYAQTYPGTDIEYRYSAVSNNGQITSEKDYLSGEEIMYQYDSLARLTSATSSDSSHTQTFTYDAGATGRA